MAHVHSHYFTAAKLLAGLILTSLESLTIPEEDQFPIWEDVRALTSNGLLTGWGHTPLHSQLLSDGETGQNGAFYTPWHSGF